MIPLIARISASEVVNLKGRRDNFFEWLNEYSHILLGAALVVIVVLAWYIHRHTSKHDNFISPALSDREEKSVFSFRSGKRRRKRKQRLPRKPTLAETGGLPPVKDDNSGLTN